MHIKFYQTTITTGILILFLFSCQSPEQLPDDAFELARQDKLASDAFKENDTTVLITKPEKPAAKKEPATTVIVKANVPLDEWSTFISEIEKKILANTSAIQKLKSNPELVDRLRKKIVRLEKDNNAIRKTMDEYLEEVRMRWANFKVLTNHDANQIEIELKDLLIGSGK